MSDELKTLYFRMLKTKSFWNVSKRPQWLDRGYCINLVWKGKKRYRIMDKVYLTKVGD